MGVVWDLQKILSRRTAFASDVVAARDVALQIPRMMIAEHSKLNMEFSS
jgi:hypothetical protein